MQTISIVLHSKALSLNCTINIDKITFEAEYSKAIRFDFKRILLCYFTITRLVFHYFPREKIENLNDAKYAISLSSREHFTVMDTLTNASVNNIKLHVDRKQWAEQAFSCQCNCRYCSLCEDVQEILNDNELLYEILYKKMYTCQIICVYFSRQSVICT